MRNQLLEAVRKHAEGHIAKHVANIEVYLKSPVGVGDHPDIIETIEKELSMIGEYEEQIELLNKYFPQNKEVL